MKNKEHKRHDWRLVRLATLREGWGSGKQQGCWGGMLVGGVTSYKMDHPAACRRLQLSSQIHNQNISAHHQKWEFEKGWVLRGREGNVMLSGGCEWGENV